VQHLFLNEKFATNVGHLHEALLASPYFQRLDESLGGALQCSVGNPDGPLVLVGVIAGDGVQLHEKGNNTTAVIALKILNLPSFLIHKLLASFHILLISGPKEPSILHQLLLVLLRALDEYRPSTAVGADGKRALCQSGTAAGRVHRCNHCCGTEQCSACAPGYIPSCSWSA
jgi:hypothetical protein